METLSASLGLQEKPASESVEKLLARIAAGDHGALGSLYDQLGALVFGVALRMVRHPGAAEVITREVFRNVWQRAALALDPRRDSVRTWIVKLVHDRSLTWLRFRPLPPFLGESSSQMPSALELAYFEGLSCREIAERLRVSPQAARSDIRQQLDELRPGRPAANDPETPADGRPPK